MKFGRGLRRLAHADPNRPRLEPLEARRLMAAGDLDPTFGTAGKVVSDFNPRQDLPADVAIAADGGIFVAGGNDRNFVVARYRSNGALDTNFGTGGTAVATNTFGHAEGMALQADGKIVVAGGDGIVNGSKGTVLRYTAAGRADTTFDGDGLKSLTTPNEYTEFHAVAVQADGKIVVAGEVHNITPDDMIAGDTLVARFNANGTLDTSFSGDGWTTIPFAGVSWNWANAVAVQSDGKIVVAVDLYAGGGIAVARLTPSGALDTTFDGDGRAILESGSGASWPSSIIVRGDGRILVGGRSISSPAVYRLLPTGAPDPGFGNGTGLFRKSQTSGINMVGGEDMALTPDGHIVLTGDNLSGTGPLDHNLAVLMLREEGTLETGFGTGGIVVVDDGGGEGGLAVAVQPDRKVVVAGGKRVDFTDTDILLARLLDGPMTGGLSGTVADDTNASGALDAGDPRLADITVFLDLDQNRVRDASEPSTTTDAEGRYSFTGLATGTYQVRAVLPPNWTQVLPANGQSASAAVMVGSTRTGLDFLLRDRFAYATVVARVFDDANGNGQVDPGESFPWERLVYADLNNNGAYNPGEPADTTDTNGRAEIRIAQPGTYKLRQQLPTDWVQTTPADGQPFIVTVDRTGQTITAGDFGARFVQGPGDTDVLVASSGWTEPFEQKLIDEALGGIPGVDVSTIGLLPWSGIDRVRLWLERPPAIETVSLAVRGVAVANYAVSGKTYDRGLQMITWTLTPPVRADRLTLDFTGADADCQLSVLPGDVTRDGRVNAVDLSNVRARQLTSTTNPGTLPNAYSVYYDVTGDGRINAVDLGIVRANQLQVVPVNLTATTLRKKRNDVLL